MGTIVVREIGKAYKQYAGRWARLAEWVWPFAGVRHSLKWVLQGISFTVRPGEAVGIIGMNGAGKSTLLKMITGTTLPTVGSISMTGRVAAMLELGMGFHPDFSGRQNVIMAGQLLGMSADEIHRLMPEIESFAEIGEYIDKPVRMYSSGMQMRLAFSIATAKRPDILIVDEALSVGDAYFQHKSFDRIRQFRAEGTTLLIVSHDKTAIQSICDRAILLNDGRLATEGTPEFVMDYYNALLADKENASVRQIETTSGKLQTVSGTGEVVVDKVELLNSVGESLELVRVGETVTLKVKVHAKQDVDSLVVGYMIKDRVGQPIFGTNTYHLGQELFNVTGGATFEFSFEFAANLGEGSYSVAIAVHGGDVHVGNNYEWRDLALVFNVLNATGKVFVGSAWLPPTFECAK